MRELFDLEQDPDELRSVYGEPARSAVTKRLKQGLRELCDRYNVSQVVTAVREFSVGESRGR